MATETVLEQRSQSASLARQLRCMLLDGKFDPQAPLPSQRELAGRYKVGVQVVRSALSLLEQEGLVYSLERRGTFVRLGRSVDSQKLSGSSIRCINLVERPTGTTPGVVRTGYLQGYTEVLEHLDAKMRIVTCPARNSGWEALFSPNFAFREQGCVLINLPSVQLMQWLKEHKAPFVVQNNKYYDASELPEHHSIYINKVHGGFEAAQHLLALGHLRIGFIGSVHPDAIRRYDVYGGCHAAVTCSGRQVRETDILSLETNELAMAVEPVLRFIDRADGPTAYVAQNDALALAVLQASKQLGRRVPEDLSVIGYDDLPGAERSDPPLTTVSNPRVMLGRGAVEVLLDASAGKFTEPQTRALEGCLVVRGSTAPPGT